MTAPFAPEPGRAHYPVIVVGASQAGLAVSFGLQERGIEHLVFERHRVGHAWRNERWDSFCLVTPNWQCQLPGFAYPGDDPDGFMAKGEIVAYVEAYRDQVRPPLLEGVAVTGLRQGSDGRFTLETGRGSFTADEVVVAVSGYHVPNIPRVAERLPQHLRQLHSRDYKNPAQVPEGGVLVVGSGQSGCQIAEDLHLAGRQVHLCVGSAPKSPRVYRGRDATAWLHDMGYYELPVERHPLKEAVRRKANHYLTGRDGGREIDLRRFALEGMSLHGRVTGADGVRLELSPDLARNLDAADAVAEGIKAAIDKHIADHRIEAPAEARYRPVWQPPEEGRALDLDAAGVRSVIWATGFRSDFGWVEIPVFDGRGYPSHQRGVTPVGGLYFIGLPWLHTWGSGRFLGVGRDALHIVERIDRRRRPPRPRGRVRSCSRSMPETALLEPCRTAGAEAPADGAGGRCRRDDSAGRSHPRTPAVGSRGRGLPGMRPARRGGPWPRGPATLSMPSRQRHSRHRRQRPLGSGLPRDAWYGREPDPVQPKARGWPPKNKNSAWEDRDGPSS